MRSFSFFVLLADSTLLSSPTMDVIVLPALFWAIVGRSSSLSGLSSGASMFSPDGAAVLRRDPFTLSLSARASNSPGGRLLARSARCRRAPAGHRLPECARGLAPAHAEAASCSTFLTMFKSSTCSSILHLVEASVATRPDFRAPSFPALFTQFSKKTKSRKIKVKKTTSK